ncbi:MAG: hypothetical protein F6K24_08640 [Okeania sp. SIO2D1]|nr:hypothetical protein [Okeania sp. SIO2D1]
MIQQLSWSAIADLVECFISCSVEYLHFGGRKAVGRRQEAEAVRPRVGVRRKGMRTPVREERVKRDKVFL